MVAIIDGVMLTDAAVGHREILNLLRSGVTVIGGGSMGALRAAELQDLGMIGIGRIFEEYASGRIEGDDEVVLLYDPHTLSALSEPLINLRLNLERAVEEKILHRGAALNILEELRTHYYPQRDLSQLLAIARISLETVDYERVEKFFKSSFEDFKKKDAFLVLEAVKKIVLTGQN